MARSTKPTDNSASPHAAPQGKAVNSDFPRITVHPRRMDGNACIRDMRITVTNVLELLAAGHSEDEILAEFPYLERDDFRDVLGYAAWCTGRQRLARTA